MMSYDMVVKLTEVAVTFCTIYDDRGESEERESEMEEHEVRFYMIKNTRAIMGLSLHYPELINYVLHGWSSLWSSSQHIRCCDTFHKLLSDHCSTCAKVYKNYDQLANHINNQHGENHIHGELICLKNRQELLRPFAQVRQTFPIWPHPACYKFWKGNASSTYYNYICYW